MNGSHFSMNGFKYRIINTCSIDYFIIILAAVGKFNKSFNSIINNDLKKLIMELTRYVFMQNNWDLARFSFLNFKKHLKPRNNQNNEIEWNCFLSEYEAYMCVYNEFQLYDWTKTCREKDCRPKTGCSPSFILKYLIFFSKRPNRIIT